MASSTPADITLTLTSSTCPVAMQEKFSAGQARSKSYFVLLSVVIIADWPSTPACRVNVGELTAVTVPNKWVFSGTALGEMGSCASSIAGVTERSPCTEALTSKCISRASGDCAEIVSGNGAVGACTVAVDILSVGVSMQIWFVGQDCVPTVSVWPL